MMKQKVSAILSTILVVAWILLALMDMWVDVMSLAVFIKVTVSVFVVLLLLVVFWFHRTSQK